MSLRLGVLCAVIDDSRCVLLSRRGDLNTWNLPGGRLDSGERLEDAAVREVREETGVSAQIERAVGLYHLSGWQRLNVLYAGFPLGGELQAKTRETRANRYFSSGSLPRNTLGAKEALAEVRPQPRVVTWTRTEQWRLRLRFGWRWLINRVTGHPEPTFPHFHVRAVGVLTSDEGRRVLTLPGSGYNPADSAVGFRTLPRVVCDGETAPWEQLGQYAHRIISVVPDFHWVGLWQNADRGMFEFVFAAAIREAEFPGSAQWTTTRNAALSDRDMAYVERVKPTFARDSVWTITARGEADDIITPDHEVKL